MKNREKKRNGDVINLNYPPKDMPMEEIERFWGEPTEDLAEFAKKVRQIEPKKGKRAKPNIL